MATDGFNKTASMLQLCNNPKAVDRSNPGDGKKTRRAGEPLTFAALGRIPADVEAHWGSIANKRRTRLAKEIMEQPFNESNCAVCGQAVDHDGSDNFVGIETLAFAGTAFHNAAIR
jgi:hypothetical protein